MKYKLEQRFCLQCRKPLTEFGNGKGASCDNGCEMHFTEEDLSKNGQPSLAMKSKEQASVHSPDEVREFEAACLDMAKSYVLGTPESRAIITAIEHARAAIVALQHPAKEMGE